MSFAAAAGLWLALLAVPVIALYVLKIRRPRAVVPYLRMWADVVGEKRFNTLFQRLQKLLSLLLQLLVLASLVGAFAMLTLGEGWLEEESVVVVVDTSASMNGRERDGADRTRFAAALAQARELVEGRSAEDELAIVAAGAQPEVLQGFSRSTLRLREALAALRVTEASGDRRAAHRLAGDLVQGKKHPRILLLTDRAGGEAAALGAEDPRVRWLPAGAAAGNVGIVRFQARKNHGVGTDYVLAVVRNFGGQAARSKLLVEVDGKLLKVRPLELAPFAEHQETLELTLPHGGFATARLEHEPPAGAGAEPVRDGLALDDVAHAAIAPVRQFRVLMVTAPEDEAAPFRAAFTAAGALVDGKASVVRSKAEWPALAATAGESFDLVLFVDWAPERLPERGNYLCVNALPGGLPATLREPELRARVQDHDQEHPLNRFLEVKELEIASARPLDLTGGQAFLATAGGPIGVVFQNRSRRVVYVGVHMLADLFFLQVQFPILLRYVLGWLHEADVELLEPTYRPGQPIRPRQRVADREVEVGWRRDGSEAAGTGAGSARVAVRDGAFTFADTARTGCYWLAANGTRHRTAVNLFDPLESDLWATSAAAAAAPDVDRAGFLFGRELWPLLLLLAVGLSVLEWGLFHRRFTE
jgi:hypothetical protein